VLARRKEIFMLYVTDRALAALTQLRSASEAQAGESILLYLEEDGSLGLALAEIEEGDNVIEQDGEVVVIVADDLATALDGMTLDVEFSEAGDEVEFVIVDDSDEDLEADGDEPFRLNGHENGTPAG
jgi:Fe-S cluster assembly iron-binding protein IscA